MPRITTHVDIRVETIPARWVDIGDIYLFAFGKKVQHQKVMDAQFVDVEGFRRVHVTFADQSSCDFAPNEDILIARLHLRTETV